jgi:hypothetical protein
MERAIRIFQSVVDGEQAEVRVYADRLEWEQRVLRLARRNPHIEATWLMRQPPCTEVETLRVPVAAMTSVTVWAACSTFTAISVDAAPAPIEFRVSHSDAVEIADLLTGLVLGAAMPLQADAPNGVVALPAQVRGTGIADQIRTLGALYAAGILSAEEFFVEREALMG